MSSLEKLTTEGRNPASERIDEMSALEIVRLMNAEDGAIGRGCGAGIGGHCAGD